MHKFKSFTLKTMKNIFGTRKNIFFIITVCGLLLLIALFIPATHTYCQNSSLHLYNIKRITKSIYLVQHEYYDPARIKPLEMLEEGLFELAKEVPAVLPTFTQDNLKFQLGAVSLSIDLKKVSSLYDLIYPLSEIFDFLHANYQGDVSYEDMEYAVIAGMLSVLDPHSNILPPDIYKEFKTQTQGEYGGLGIVISLKDKELTVIAPFEGTPADKEGIKADDKILQIDDQSTTNMPLDEAVDLMRGPPGTRVTLKIKSKNRDPRDVILTREVIAVTSVQAKLISKNQENFGIIHINGFQDNTYKDVVTEFDRLNKKANNKLKGLVLDLRNNAGGLLDQAILVADLFLNEGDIVFTVGAGNTAEDSSEAARQSNDIELPMVVLINEGSASAAEIVAGALKNNDRAIVMGKRSFGKGSVQSLFNMKDDSSLKLTVAQYLTPGRESIQAVGITPDIHLYPSAITADFFDLHEDISYSEEKLDAHLSNENLIKRTLARYSLTYLEEEAEDQESRSAYTQKIKEQDFALQLATKILSTAANTSRTATLQNLGVLLKTEAQAQDQLIVEALKKKNIDWSLGQATATADTALDYEFVDPDGHKLTDIPAGKDITLKVSVTNQGKQALHRVLTSIEAENPLLNHKEFVFGKLEPGEKKSADTLIKVPAEIINFREDIKFVTYTEKTTEKPAVQFAQTHFVEQAQPRYSYAYQIFDGSKSGSSGNSNNIPEPGENIIMQISLTNQGPGLSKNTIVNIKNKEGKYTFLNKARETLGELPPQQTKIATLNFSLKKNFAKDKFEIEVFALDDETKASINDTLSFDLKKPLTADPKPNQLQTAPVIVFSSSTKQSGDKLQLQAIVDDAVQLKDIAVFVKGKKIIYLNVENEKGTKHKELSTIIPLEEGVNSIVIQARGTRNLLSQKSMSVVYNKDVKLAGK